MSLSLNLGEGPLATISGSPTLLSGVQDILEAYEGQLGHLVYSREKLDEIMTTRGVLSLLLQDERFLLSLRADSLRLRELCRRSVVPEGLSQYLRPYQMQAVASALSSFFGTAIIKAPTGSGKTRIAAGIVAVAGGYWLYVAPNVELVSQARQAFDDLIPKMHSVAGRSAMVAGATYGMLPAPSPPGGVWSGVIFDEVHCMPTASRVGACFAVEAGFYIGLSATPLSRQDDKNGMTISLCGPVAYEVQTSELERDGFIAKGKITTVLA